MANSAIVGILRALLGADTADFVSSMGKSADAAQQFQSRLTETGKTFAETGVRMSALRGIIADLGGAFDVRKAEEYAAAIKEIGGVSKLTTEDQKRVNAVMQEALSHYRAVGQEAPAHLKKIEEATRSALTQTKSFGDQLKDLSTKSFAAGTTLTAALTAPLAGAAAVSVKAAMDFESAFAGVRKTVGGTPEQLDEVNKQFREMARVTPVSAVGLAKIGEMAGQLGVHRDTIAGFTKTIVDISVATHLTAEEAGSSFARLANVMKMPQEQFSNLGSAVVALGNFGASTEQEMLNMGQRIAAAGATANMTVPQVLGIANALSSVGIEAEAGGTAISRVINKMSMDVASGGGHLATFAKVSKMSAEEFQDAWRKDAGQAFSQFMQGLASAREKGGDELLKLMHELGFDANVRLTNAFLSAANAGKLMSESIELGTKSFKENTELTRAAGERYKTAANQLEILKNNVTDVAIEFGNVLLPILNDVVKATIPLVHTLEDAVKWFSTLPESVKLTALAFGGLVASIGPLLLIVGGLARGITSLIELYAVWRGSSAVLAAATGKTAVAVEGVGASLLKTTGQFASTVGWIGAIALALRELTGSWEFLTDPIKATGELLADVGSIASETGSILSESITGEVKSAEQGVHAFIKAMRDAVITFNTLGQTVKNETSPALDSFVKQFPALAQELDRIKEKSKKENFGDPFELAKAGAEEYLDKLRLIHAQLKEDQGTAPMPTVKPPEIFTPAPKKGASGMKTPSVSDLTAKFEKMQPIPSDQVNKALSDAQAHLKDIKDAIVALSPEMKKLIISYHEAGDGADLISKNTHVAEEVITAYLKQVQAATKSNKEAAKSQDDYKKEVAAWNKEVVNGTRTAVNMIRDIGGVVKAFNDAHAAMIAIAELNRPLSAPLQSAIRAMIDAGLSASETFTRLKALGRVTDEDKESVERFGGAYGTLEKELRASTSTGGGLVKFIDAQKNVKLHLDAGISALIASDEAHRRLSPSVESAARQMLSLGMSADEVFKKLEAEGSVTERDKLKIEALGKAHDALSQSLSGLSQAFANLAQIGGAKFEGVVKQVAQVIAAVSAANEAINAIGRADVAKKAAGGWNVATVVQAAAGYAALATAVYSVVSGLMEAARKKAEVENMLKDAERTAEHFGSTLGHVSTALQDTINRTITDLARLKGVKFTIGMDVFENVGDSIRRVIAESLHLVEIIKELGGVTDENLPRIVSHFEILFNLVKGGGKLGADALAAIEAAFPEVAQAATDAAGLLDDSVVRLIKLDEAMGIHSKAIAAYRREQMTNAETGIASAIKVTTDAYAEQAKLVKEKSDLEKQLADATGEGQEEIEKKLDEVNAALLVQQQIIDVTALHSQEAATAVVGALVGAIDSAMASGETFIAAVLEQQGAIENLKKALSEAGLEGGAAFELLQGQLDLATDKVAGPALLAIEGYTAGVIGLSNAGKLTADSFGAIENQIGATQAKLESLGFDHKQVMFAMQHDLQVAWELQKKFPGALDETTQALVDEAEAAGLVGEEHKSASDQMLDATKKIAQSVEDLVVMFAKAFGVDIPKHVDAATNAALGLKRAIDDVPDEKTIEFTTRYTTEGEPPQPGEQPGQPDYPSYAVGGFVSGPTIAKVGDAPGGEWIFPNSVIEKLGGAMSQFADLAKTYHVPRVPDLQRLPALADTPSSSIGPMQLPLAAPKGGGTVIVQLGARMVAQIAVPEIEGEVRRLGFGRGR